MHMIRMSTIFACKPQKVPGLKGVRLELGPEKVYQLCHVIIRAWRFDEKSSSSILILREI